MAEPKISMREDEMNKVHQEQTRPPVIEADFLFVSLVQLPTIVPALRQAFPRMGEEEILSKLSRAMVKSHLAGKTAAKYAYIPRTDNLDFREYVTQLEEWTRTEFKEPDANRESLFAQTDRTQLVAIIRQVIPAMTPNPSVRDIRRLPTIPYAGPEPIVAPDLLLFSLVWLPIVVETLQLLHPAKSLNDILGAIATRLFDEVISLKRSGEGGPCHITGDFDREQYLRELNEAVETHHTNPTSALIENLRQQ